MIDVFLLTWAWMLTATFIEAQAANMIAKSCPPPKRKVCCNYIMKEEK